MEKNLIGKISKGDRHIAVPLNKYCIYLEFRSGNFLQAQKCFFKKNIKASYVHELK